MGLIDKIAKTVGEETAELIIASQKASTRPVIEESADLFYHLLVLLVEKETPLEDVVGELKARHKV